MTNKKSFYRLFKVFLKIRSPRLKVMALLAAHLAGRRYIGVFLDPVLACNIRCRMCYFSDEAKRPKAGMPLTMEQLDKIEKAFFKRALKLQIGCGAEPTVFPRLKEIVERGKKAGVPYIEITTNGQLLDYEKLKDLVDAGLDGITLSLHGTTQQTYEYLMQGAKFPLLLRLIEAVGRVQREYPAFALRVNYTMNNLNFRELSELFRLFGEARVNVLQVRPIQRMGDTMYADFSLDEIIEEYDSVIEPLRKECAERGVTSILPSVKNLRAVDDKRSELNSLVESVTYCYISNQGTYKPDFDLEKETFDSYWKRHGLVRRLISICLRGVKNGQSKVEGTKKLNYTID